MPNNITPPNRQLIQTTIDNKRQDKVNANSTRITNETAAKNAVTVPVRLSR